MSTAGTLSHLATLARSLPTPGCTLVNEQPLDTVEVADVLRQDVLVFFLLLWLKKTKTDQKSLRKKGLFLLAFQVPVGHCREIGAPAT